MAKTSEVKEGEQTQKVEPEQAKEVTLLGLNKYYVLGGGLLLVAISIIAVFVMVEDREQRNMFLQMGLYNVACVVITYFMTQRLKKQRQTRLDE